MAAYKLFVVLILSCLLFALVQVSGQIEVLLSCGGPNRSTDEYGREWSTDIGSNFLMSSGKSFTSPADSQKPSVPQVPCTNARVFQSEFTYSFPVSSGRKFLRLYFYPAVYNKLNPYNGIFSVRVGQYTLLRNFSAAQTTEALNFDYMIKEFSIYVPSGALNVTFTPSGNYSNSFAFVNGIEVVAHPDIYNTDDGSALIVGQSSSPFYIGNTTALEGVYRLNVGGNVISPSSDTGMFRSWDEDSKYIFGGDGVTETADDYNLTIPPTSIAPVDVYRTLRSMGPNATLNVNYNLTWFFPVDSGFFYLVRLHFCEVTNIITKTHQREFHVYLSNQTTEPDADVIAWAGPNPIPAPKQTEIDPFDPSSRRSGRSKNRTAAIAGGVGGGIGAILLIGLAIYFASRRPRQKTDSSPNDRPSEESGNGLGGMDVEDSFNATYEAKRDPNASPGFDVSTTDSRSSGMTMSIGGRSLASEDSDGLTPSAVFSQIMNPKGR
nr:receptor-like protein kinase FERONIA [Ipomoea batatas]